MGKIQNAATGGSCQEGQRVGRRDMMPSGGFLPNGLVLDFIYPFAKRPEIRDYSSAFALSKSDPLGDTRRVTAVPSVRR